MEYAEPEASHHYCIYVLVDIETTGAFGPYAEAISFFCKSGCHLKTEAGELRLIIPFPSRSPEIVTVACITEGPGILLRVTVKDVQSIPDCT